MDQFNLDVRPETSPLVSELVKRLILYESSLTEMKRTLDEMNRKVDILLAQSTANHAPASNNVIAPNQNLSHVGWGLGGEFVPSRSLIQTAIVGRSLLLLLVGEAFNLPGPSSLIPDMGPNNELDVLWQNGPSGFEDFNLLGTHPQRVITNSYVWSRLIDKR